MKIVKFPKIYIIAEAGVNHNGDINLAKKLIDAAKKCGADAIKFQNFITEELIRKNAPKAPYQNRNIGKQKTQYQMLKELELSEKDTLILKKTSEQKNIEFISTPYDEPSLQLLLKIGVKKIKLASTDIVYHPMIKKVAKSKKILILSTGMATEKEIKEAVRIFCQYNNKDNLCLLQCNTNYPARPEDQNLRALSILKKYTPIVGFSDHTIGNEASIVAVALGAKIIEKHFTLDKNMPGPDHKASLSPNQFKKFVRSIRKAELTLGNEQKIPIGGELENIKGMRRSICAKVNIPKNTIIKYYHLAFKRPGNGLMPTENNIKLLIGRKTKKNIKKDENITLDKIT